MSAWLGYEVPRYLVKDYSARVFLMRLTFKLIEWVEQAVLPTVSGLHLMSQRPKWNKRLPLPWIKGNPSGLLAIWPELRYLQILNLPDLIIEWANSLKQVSFFIYPLVLYLWRTLANTAHTPCWHFAISWVWVSSGAQNFKDHIMYTYLSS